MSVLRGTMAMIAIALCVCLAPRMGQAAPYAALVMDARTGEVYHARSADRRLHPASLTKMMTLYLAFEAIGRGEVKLDQKVRISKKAARQVPSKIGLRAGRTVTIRHLIRATAVKSANDAAVALAEALGGSEQAFAKKMTARARQLGMKNTQFKNASGLTAKGQYSSARDMAILGRRLFYDFPQYYNLFGRKKTYAYGRTIHSTNRRLLNAYSGADGIKTGYTRAAGFNLVSSAKRGDKRIIAVVFGGKSSRSRNRRIAELLDLGFKRAPRYAKVVKPSRVALLRSPAPIPRPRSGEPAAPVITLADAPVEEPSLITQAGVELGAALVPAAQAAELPANLSAYAPLISPRPASRPGAATEPDSLVIASSSRTPIPQPRPGSTDPSAYWAVQIGVFAREETAIAELASAALSDIDGLDTAGRDVLATELSGKRLWRAQLTGLEQSEATAACRELKSRGKDCLTIAGVGN